jgi:hypothetical protein
MDGSVLRIRMLNRSMHFDLLVDSGTNHHFGSPSP